MTYKASLVDIRDTESWNAKNYNPWPEEWLNEKDAVNYKKNQSVIIKRNKKWQKRKQK